MVEDNELFKMFDSVETVLVSPVKFIMEQDKEVCKKYVGDETPVKIIIGKTGELQMRAIYTKPTPDITEEFKNRVETFKATYKKLFDEDPEKFGEMVSMPTTLPNGNVINLVMRRFEASLVVYALPPVVIGNLELILTEDSGVSKMILKTTYPTTTPDAITTRVHVFTPTTRNALDLFRRFLSEVSPVLDGFSKEIIEIVSDSKLNLPEEEIRKVTSLMNKRREEGQSRNDPSFF